MQLRGLVIFAAMRIQLLSMPVSKIALLVFFSLLWTSCFQYPEGPIFTMQTRDERLSGTWGVLRVTDPSGNDVTEEVDETGTPVYKSITLTVQVNRSGDRNWSVFKNNLVHSLGTYDYAEFGDELVVLFTFYQGAETYLQKFYTIRKLTSKEFIYVDDRGMEWKMGKF